MHNEFDLISRPFTIESNVTKCNGLLKCDIELVLNSDKSYNLQNTKKINCYFKQPKKLIPFRSSFIIDSIYLSDLYFPDLKKRKSLSKVR